MVAPLIARGAAALVSRAAKRAPKAKMETDEVMSNVLAGGAAAGTAAGAGAMAMGQSKRTQDAANRDRAIARTEGMQRSAAKARTDESIRHYKGVANATKQK